MVYCNTTVWMDHYNGCYVSRQTCIQGLGSIYFEEGTHKETLHFQRNLKIKNKWQENKCTTRWVVDRKTDAVIA